MTNSARKSQYGAVCRERDELTAHCERLREAAEWFGVYFRGGTGLTPLQVQERVTQILNETPAQSLREIRSEAVESAAKTLMPSMPPQPDDPPEGFNDYCEALAEVKRFAQQIREGKE